MKSSILSTLLMLSLSAALSPVHLMAQGPIHFTIPFDFAVGPKSFAAGQYNVRQLAYSAFAIQSADGHHAMVTITHAGQPNSKPGIAMLTFSRYGDRYFLSQVSDNDRGWELPKSAGERELVSKRGEPNSVSVVAGVK